MQFVRQNAIGLLALFVALSGTAYANQKIRSNQIERGAVATAHIKRGAVATRHLKNRSVTAAKIKPWSISRRHLSFAIPSPAPAPPPPPPAGVGEVVRVKSPMVFIPPGETSYGMHTTFGQPDLKATCPAGKVPVGGGFDTGIGEVFMLEPVPDGIVGFVANPRSINIDASVTALCASGTVAQSYSTDLGVRQKLAELDAAFRQEAAG